MIIIPVNYPPPLGPMTPRANPPTALIYHHSDGSPTQTPLEIDAEHRAENPPFMMIGYQLVIGPDGKVYRGRPDDVWPAAAEGYNEQSVDVCLLGDFQPDTPLFQSTVPVAQFEAAVQVCIYYHNLYPTINRTMGHRDVAPLIGVPGDATDCPGQILYDRIPEIIARYRQYVAMHPRA